MKIISSSLSVLGDVPKRYKQPQCHSLNELPLFFSSFPPPRIRCLQLRHMQNPCAFTLCAYFPTVTLFPFRCFWFYMWHCLYLWPQILLWALPDISVCSTCLICTKETSWPVAKTDEIGLLLYWLQAIIVCAISAACSVTMERFRWDLKVAWLRLWNSKSGVTLIWCWVTAWIHTTQIGIHS